VHVAKCDYIIYSKEMTSKDPREPYDWFYYWNNQHEFPQAHSKQKCPNRDPFGEHKQEAKLLNFDYFNTIGNCRDYLHNIYDQNPSELVHRNARYILNYFRFEN